MISLRPPADEWEIAWRENNRSHPLVKDWKFFGVGVVVKDCEIAREYFSNLGFSAEKEVHKSKDLGVKFCHIKVGHMMFELIEPTADDSIYLECLNARGEGIADISFIVKDLQSEAKDFEEKGADILFSTNECTLIDTRKEGNTLIRLFKNA
jgi:4-hydroxyphenylpyruvate dioxygenase-like putative hemolysin